MVKLSEQLRYTRLINGRLFWEPSKAMRACGFEPIAIGPDTPANRQRVKNLYAEAKEAVARKKAGLPEKKHKPTYPPGSLEQFYQTWIRSPYFLQGKARRTVEEYHTAWKHIGPQLGSKLITKITLADCESFDVWLEENTTSRTRKRCIAKLKQTLKQAHARGIIAVNPAQVIRTHSPKPRQAIFYPQEIQDLVDGATTLNMHAMSLCIRLIYACGFAPVDARKLTMREFKNDRQGYYLDLARQKTGVDGVWTFERDPSLPNAIFEYIALIDAEILPDAPIFRRHVIARDRGHPIPWRDSSEFSEDFALVRKYALGTDEIRVAYDIRRTFNHEAKLGDASPEERAAIMANGLDKNARLDQTYSPVTLESARKALRKSLSGQQIRKQISQKENEFLESSEKPTAQFFGMIQERKTK